MKPREFFANVELMREAQIKYFKNRTSSKNCITYTILPRENAYLEILFLLS